MNTVLVNISELLEQNHLQFQGTAVLKDTSFAIDLPGETLFAYADPEALNKILSNHKFFLDKLDEVINKHMAGNLFDVDHLAEAMNMSRPTLYRKIKSISNLSLHALINITRLKRGAAVLVESDYKICKIATMIGFNSQAQFTRSFQKQFGIAPKKYANSKK